MFKPRLLALMTLLAATMPLAAQEQTRADVNGDGRTDSADVELMRALFFGADSRADLDRDGRVDFADLALLKAAMSDDAPRINPAPRALAVPPPAPSVYLLPETQSVNHGDRVAVDIYWDFTGEAALGGGTDFTWDPTAFSLVSILFDDNFGTGPGQFDPAFTRCDDEPCSGPGFIEALATGNFNGLGDPGPIYIATLTFDTLRAGNFTITAAEDAGLIAGPFISAIDFLPYDNLLIAGASVDIQPEPRIGVEALEVAFPNTIIGDTSSAQVRVSSVGGLPLTISGVSLPELPFTLALDACTGQVLAPDEGCDLTLAFSPTEIAPFSSFILIDSDDPRQPEVEVTMSGVGVAAPLPDIAARRVLRLPDTRVGQTTHATLTVRNRGSDPLAIGLVGAANPLEPPFVIDADNCSNRTIQSGQACLIRVGFTPTAAAPASGDFDIPSNDPDTPSFVVGARGTGEPRITLSAFGIQADGGRCNNRDTGQSVVSPLNGGTILPCESIGLTANSGAELMLFMRGVADSASALGGRGLGMSVGIVRCLDESTGQTVTINPPGPGTDWNCVGAGLVVTPGDTVSMSVFGAAL